MALTQFQIENAEVGRHADGRGLYLLVQPTGRRSWVLRVQSKGCRRDFGLGAVDSIALDEVRDKAARWRALAKQGRDPSVDAGAGSAASAAPEEGPGSAPRRRTQAERTALSDDLMYQATMELLWAGGIHKMTLREVGERAGYSRGLASARFGTKEGLFAGLVQNMAATWRADVASTIGKRTGLAALLSVLDALDQFLEEKPLYAKALFILWYETASSQNEIRTSLAAVHDDRQRVVAFIKEGQAQGSIRADLSAERFAIQFMSFIFGIIYQWHMSPAEIDVSDAIADYRRTVIDLVGVPEETPLSGSLDMPYLSGGRHDKEAGRPGWRIS